MKIQHKGEQEILGTQDIKSTFGKSVLVNSKYGVCTNCFIKDNKSLNDKHEYRTSTDFTDLGDRNNGYHEFACERCGHTTNISKGVLNA